MPTLFLDYEGGNDGNNGSSFANRFKTVDTGATAARTAPGDTIRIMASPDPTSLGQNASFTDKSDTITLTTAVTANVSLCESAWTPSTNITASVDGSNLKQGTNSTSIAPAGAFTTGLAAYEAMGSTDFSSYQQLSFWIRSSVNVAANSLSVKLCSDAVGATPVDSFQIPHNLVASRWYPITINKGSALGSAIQSVALYIDIDFGAATILLDNILACKSVASADSLTLRSLIGKGPAGELYFPIRSINGTTIKLDSNSNSSFGSTPRGYSGATESVDCSKRECIIFAPSDTSTAWGNVQESGTSGNPITYSGGWNRTDMSTQTGVTYIDCLTSQVPLLNTLNFNNVEKLVAVRPSIGGQSGTDCVWTDCGAIGSGNSPFSLVNARITVAGTIFAAACNSTMNLGSPTLSLQNAIALSTQAGIGITLGTTSGSTIKHTGTLKANNCSSNGCSLAGSGQYGDLTTSGNGSSGVLTSGSTGKQTVQSLTAVGNTGYALSANAQTYLTINGLNTSGNTSGVINFAGTNNSHIIIRNATYAEGTFHNGTIDTGSGAILQVHNDNAPNVHFTKTDGGITRSETGADRRTASGIAWRLSPTSSTIRTALYPLRQRLTFFKLLSGIPKDIKVWVKRTTSAVISGRLICPKGQIAGISTDQIANASAADGVYEQLSLTLTSSEDGIVEVFCEAWGGTTDSMYIDDPSL